MLAHKHPGVLLWLISMPAACAYFRMLYATAAFTGSAAKFFVAGLSGGNLSLNLTVGLVVTLCCMVALSKKFYFPFHRPQAITQSPRQVQYKHNKGVRHA
jgi:hypothetical protein